MKNSRKIFVLALLALFAQVTVAQTADEIIENYLKATGGKDKWATVQSTRMIAKIKTQGQEFPMTMLSEAPNKQKMFISVGSNVVVLNAFDGKEGWKSNLMTGKIEKNEAEDSENAASEMDFPEPFANYKNKGYSVALEGEESIEGTACYKIKLTKKPIKVDGKEEENFSHYFFDKESGVPMMTRKTEKKGQLKGVTIDIFVSDYQEVNGLFFPFTMTQKVNGQTEGVIVIEKVEVNTDIDDAEFAFPKN
jgi:outer membrane lipoprotein-sorting protein